MLLVGYQVLSLCISDKPYTRLFHIFAGHDLTKLCPFILAKSRRIVVRPRGFLITVLKWSVFHDHLGGGGGSVINSLLDLILFDSFW